jgi:S1-C subfamily serine protease
MAGHILSRRQAGALALLPPLVLLAACTAARPGAAAERADPGRCAESVPDIYDRVSPAVVFVGATSINPYKLADRVTHVVGSGFVIHASGLVLTNAHVAFGRQSIRVTLDDGTVLPAALVGADPIFDLAVLRIPVSDKTTLPVLALGDSDRLRVGEEVVAIGNPLGLDQTLTRGVVSALNRILADTPFSVQEPLIQTDTPINPGNSGGPLLNRCGEVVGVNTALLQEARNIGFAIPSNLVKLVLPSLVDKGRFVRPWVGFHGQLIGDELRDLLRTPLVEGLLVEVIEPNSPAQKAGLRGGQLELVVSGREYLLGGDVVTSVNGTRLDSTERMIEVTRALKVGDTLRLTIFREGGYREVEYTLPERPLLPGDISNLGLLAPAGRRPRRPVPIGTPARSW